ARYELRTFALPSAKTGPAVPQRCCGYKPQRLTGAHRRAFASLVWAITGAGARISPGRANCGPLDATIAGASVRAQRGRHFFVMVTQGATATRVQFGQLAWSLFALVALYAFIQDFMSPDWRAGILAPLVMLG